VAGAPNLLRSINARAILELVDRLGPIARPSLAKELGISRTAVTQTLADLTEAGIVQMTDLHAGSRGPAAARYALSPTFAYGAAIEITVPTITVSLLRLDGKVLVRREAPNNQDNTRSSHEIYPLAA